MRILTYSFFSLLFLTISFLVLFVITQEVLVFWGNQTIRSALFELEDLPHESVCQEYLDEFTEESVRETFQLRFTSDREFVSEVKCSPFESNVTVLAEHSLPPFVTKIPGSSGLLWEDERSGIGITAFASAFHTLNDQLSVDLTGFAKEKYLVAEGKTLVSEGELSSFGKTPAAACESYGYQCCDVIAEQGEGENLTNVTSCQQNCFAKCVRRPLILSFMSDPFPDPELREVVISNGSSVNFQYLLDVVGSKDASVELDYGDGYQERVNGVRGSTQHIFNCPTSRCSYQVVLTGFDDKGLTTVTTPLSKLTVLVIP